MKRPRSTAKSVGLPSPECLQPAFKKNAKRLGFFRPLAHHCAAAEECLNGQLGEKIEFLNKKGEVRNDLYCSVTMKF